MEELRPEALETVPARVAAWHNRHPLAGRITPEQVQSVGYVGLPYLAGEGLAAQIKAAPAKAKVKADDGDAAAPGKPSLLQRTLARLGLRKAGTATLDPAERAARKALRAAFTEDFIAPLKPRRVARWAARHGWLSAQAPRGGPLRQIDADATLAPKGSDLQTLYVLTALVEQRGKRIRLLLSPGTHDAVLGMRLWSTPRLAAGGAAACLLAGLATVAVLLWPVPAPPAEAHSAPQSAEPARSAEAGGTELPSIKPPSMRAAALAALGAASQGQATDPAHATGAATSVGASATPPTDVEPVLGRVELPTMGFVRKGPPRGAIAVPHPMQLPLPERAGPGAASAEATPAAAQPQGLPQAPAAAAQTASQTASQATAQAVEVTPPPAAPLPTPARAASAPPPAPAFALSSRRLRTRAESEQTMAAVKALLEGAGHSGVQVDVMPAGEDWRVVGWPFAQRAQAEKARQMLATRGIRLEVVDF